MSESKCLIVKPDLEMCEALRHLSGSMPFQDVTVQAKKNIKYKEVVSKSSDVCYQDFNKLTRQHWNTMLSEHCKKLQHLMTGVFSLPTSIISQYEVFFMQEKKHLTPKNEVTVLSAFPVFIADYYGYAKLPSLIAKECC